MVRVAGDAIPGEAGSEANQASSGVLVADKPRGPTSHEVVARVRRTLGLRDVGHAGTLDPMATGVLVLAVGQGTKLVHWLVDHGKSYTAAIALGVETDTLDAEGGESRRVPPSGAVLEALRRFGEEQIIDPALRVALEIERSRTQQLPPVFSAIKQKGRRAYAMARRGEAVVLEPRAVVVTRLEVVACTEAPPTLAVSLDVGKGYYVRALARDLAAALGTVGHLTSLRRTRSGPFDCEGAVDPLLPRADLLARIVPLATAAALALPVARLTDAGVENARHGRAVAREDLSPPASGPHAWLDARGALVAIGHLDGDGCGRVLRGFRAESG